MGEHYRQRQRVKWKWGDNWTEGKVTRKYTDRVTRRIKGSDVNRNATEDEPAYMIKQDDGDRVLKLHKELRKA
ncbi:DUF2945 domain-containing protein [Kushneria indalinina]|uniref:Hypervirulence associated protein TUDOR domain-containing protein n=1 Tax=Kushneria indalinina DSM 14324 TaxID=1122140 RepID=A0A3D9DUA4_9GAMM|nr:DUF2945 domain-containing protein [Kushneria indalinina]REC94225.1 hypothetical protein C8D72_2595 [Kushneria indalinina DSM 14324]